MVRTQKEKHGRVRVHLVCVSVCTVVDNLRKLPNTTVAKPVHLGVSIGSGFHNTSEHPAVQLNGPNISFYRCKSE
jgi:hypothetical protein